MSGTPQYPPQPYPSHGYPQPGFAGQPAGNPFADQPVNPYATPQYAGYYAQQLPPKPSAFAGLWRDGNLLVLHKLAPLPEICVVSNEPTTLRIRRKLQWHHPLLVLTVFIGVPVYIILALILTKRATIQLPLTEEWIARRQRRMIFAWVTGLLFVGLIVGGIALAIQMDDPSYLFLMVLGIVGGLAALIGGQATVGLVAPKRMTDDYIWLKGIHPDYLNRLEQWPYQI